MTLPHEWATVKLGECSDLIRGISFPASAKLAAPTSESIICLRTSNVQDTLETDDVLHVARSYLRRDAQRVRRNDIVISMSNSKELVGKAAIAPVDLERTAIGGFLAILRVRTIDPRFVQYLLRSSDVRQRLTSSSSITTNLANLSSAALRDLDVPLPPLPEQHRIVEALETHFTRLDAAVATLKRVRAGLKRYRAAVLQSAVEGRLGIAPSTRGHLPAGWRIQTIDELSDPGRRATYGVIKLGDEVRDGVPTLRTSNVRPLRLDVEGVKRIAPHLSGEYRRTILRGGEVLVAVRGTLGGVVVAPAACTGWNVSREVAVVALRDPQLARVVALFLSSPKLQLWLNSRTRGIAYTGINIATLKEAPIPIPPEDQRDRIVEAAEQALSIGAAADVQIDATEVRIARLRQSLLRVAFDGRLVPQDPRDEPASVLLDRIRAERTGVSSSPKKKYPRISR